MKKKEDAKLHGEGRAHAPFYGQLRLRNTIRVFVKTKGKCWKRATHVFMKDNPEFLVTH